MRSKALNALVALLSIGVSLGVAEIVARIIYVPPLEFEEETFVPYPQTLRYTPRLNALGFREDPPGDAATDPNVFRILFLGDSFTFGSGVDRGEDRFTDLIEARLNGDSPPSAAPARYHIYNAGVSSSRPVGWVRHLRRLLPSYEPDLVVAVFFLRDGTDLCTSLRCHKTTIRRIKVRYSSRFAYDASYLARFFYGRLIVRDFSEHYRQTVLNSYLGTDDERETWEKQQAALRRLQKICERRGIDFHLIVFPLLFDLDHYPYQAVEDEILGFAEEAGIPAFSLLEGFRGRDARSLWVAENDQHPNEEGHRIAAETLLPYLREAIGARR
jgi:lysophospholipase L1-like esterase